MLLVFFILVVFLIPGYFLNQITANEKDVGGVDIDNRKRFTDLINENMIGKQIPGILARSLEFMAMKVRSPEELQILKRIKGDERVKEAIPKQTDKTEALQVKPICLLTGYMYGLLKDSDHENEGINKDLEFILKILPSYLEIMLQ